jgi:hypothetical protein
MVFPGYRPVPFALDFYAYGSVGFSYSGFTGNPIDVNLFLDVTNGTDTLTGKVYSTSNAWSSQLVCYRAVTKLSSDTTPATGKYLLDLPFGSPTNNPETNGFASLSVGGGGGLTLSGALPDGASFSQSTTVSKAGVWPLYVIPSGYGAGGMLMGWETNQAGGGSTGQLYWYKKGGFGSYYTNGVDTNVISTGTNYIPPAAGDYVIVFQGGTISAPITNTLTVARAGAQFHPVSATDKLAITLSANGVLTGHFLAPNDTKPLQFEGAFFGQSKGGSGFVLEGNDKTGTFTLKAQ